MGWSFWSGFICWSPCSFVFGGAGNRARKPRTITAIIITMTMITTTTITTMATTMTMARRAITSSMRADIAGPLSWRKILAVVVSVGIRPCSGAVLVLIFALTQGLFWAGVAATFAMAFGTAITVAVLATLALGSRELALRLGGGNARWVDAVWTISAIGGALLVMMLGLLMFAASLGPTRPF